MSPTPNSADREATSSPGSSGDRASSRVPLRFQNGNQRLRRLPFALDLIDSNVSSPNSSSPRSPILPNSPNSTTSPNSSPLALPLNPSPGAPEFAEHIGETERSIDDNKSKIATPENSDNSTWFFKSDRKRDLSRLSSSDLATDDSFTSFRIPDASNDSGSPKTSRRRLSTGPSVPESPHRSFPSIPSPSTSENTANCVVSETTGRRLPKRETTMPENWNVRMYKVSGFEGSSALDGEGNSVLMTKSEKRNSPKTVNAGPPQLEKSGKTRRSMVKRDLTARRINSDGSTSPMADQKYDKTQKVGFLEQVFLLLAVIGKGSFGEVFAVRDQENQKDYAVKVLTRKVVQSATNKFREVLMLMMIPQHPNILKFEKAWEENERLHIQTELCTMTLLDLATQVVKIPEDKLWKILGDLVNALHHLHSNDVIHADVKPENVFISEDFTMKLGDFGIAIDLKQPVKDIEDGDSRYLSVEALNGGPIKASDIFALGVSLLEILSDLHVPSEGPGWHAIRDGQIHERFFSGISKELRNIIESMLQKDPKSRPTAKDIVEQLANRKRKMRTEDEDF